MKTSFNINKKSLLVSITCLFAVSLTSCSLFTQSSVEARYSAAPDVSGERLTQHVRQLSETYYPRDYTHPENLNASADYIMQQLEPYTDRLSEQKFTVRDKPYRNIIARFGPAEGELIVVGAHYDSYHKTRGADDNASGVAGLLELARLLKQHPPSSPVELVAYSLEEPPFFSTDEMGSAFHARQLAETQRPVKLMMSLEMIGYFSDEADSQDFPLSIMKSLYSDKGHFITVISNMSNRDITAQVKSLMMGASDLPVYSLNAPSFVPGIDYSDHLHYWKQDFPAVMITDTAFYRNHHYHESDGDSWDQLDYQRMAKVVQGVYATIQNLD